MLDREPGAARWRQIADAIRGEIAAGTLKAGERLATETALADRFAVNRHTVRQAVKELAHEGYLKVEHGRGTFVQGRGIDYPLRSRTRFSEIMIARGYEPHRDVLGVETVAASADEAAILKVRKGARLTRIETRALAGAESFACGAHLFPAARLPDIGETVRETGSITAALTRLGHRDYSRAWTRITAELPDARVSELLGRPRTRPVLHTESLDIAADGTPLGYGSTYFAGDICRLTVDGS